MVDTSQASADAFCYRGLTHIHTEATIFPIPTPLIWIHCQIIGQRGIDNAGLQVGAPIRFWRWIRDNQTLKRRRIPVGVESLGLASVEFLLGGKTHMCTADRLLAA